MHKYILYFFQLQQHTTSLSRVGYKTWEKHIEGVYCPNKEIWTWLPSRYLCHFRCSVISILPPVTTPEAVNISISLAPYLPSTCECLRYLRASQMTLDVCLSNWGPPFRTACCGPLNQAVRTQETYYNPILLRRQCTDNLRLRICMLFCWHLMKPLTEDKRIMPSLQSFRRILFIFSG